MPEQSTLCNAGVTRPTRADPIQHMLISSAEAPWVRFERRFPTARYQQHTTRQLLLGNGRRCFSSTGQAKSPSHTALTAEDLAACSAPIVLLVMADSHQAWLNTAMGER